METMIYESQMARGAWKWGARCQLCLLVGPADQLKRINTLNSVGSKRCPDVEIVRRIRNLDGRYWGPRSRYGKALAELHALADKIASGE